jgi:hypothetical protein
MPQAAQTHEEVVITDAPSVEHEQAIHLVNFQAPGDIVMMTAAVRDLKHATGNRFKIAVSTTAMELWQDNPFVVPKKALGPTFREVRCEYPLVHQAHRPYHFIHGMVQDLERKLNVRIPVTQFRGDIHLSKPEVEAPSPVYEKTGFGGKYWVLIAGGKSDFTTKWWNPFYYQAVIDHFKGRIQFVQCGEASRSHWHLARRGVINLVGRTTTREFVRVIHGAEGVICPITFAMHLAAAVPMPKAREGMLRPCVVIAGGREQAHWEQYPGHRFLENIGTLSCNAKGACWRNRCQLIGDGDEKDRNKVCTLPVQIDDNIRIPQCMQMITPEHVIAAVESYYSGGVLTY